MRSFRRALGLLAASAPLALAVACADPELKSDLVTEGPPEVTEVNVLSESVILADPTFLRLGEAATFCRTGDYKVNQVYCPEERDSTMKPIFGERATDPVADVMPYAVALGMEDVVSDGATLPSWHIRFIFDELLDPSVEDIVDLDGTTFGSIADTMPVTVTCNDADLTYDGFYDPSGNHLSYPPGPALVVQVTDFVATGSACSVSINAGSVADKDGNDVPSDQQGPYDFSIAALGVYSTAPADTEEGVDPTGNITIELNAPINLATVEAAVTLEDEAGDPVPFTVQNAPVDPADPAAGTIPNLVELVPNAPLDANAAYTLTIDSGIADIAGGELALDAPQVVTFTTGEAE
jgi:hypothetical protein